MTLHKLQEGFIVTSDEVVKHTEKWYNPITGDIGINWYKNEIPKEWSKTLKVIAQQDQIDFSALTEEEEQKKIGWFDVDEFAQNRFTGSYDSNYNLRFGFKEGFQKAQELLTSDRRFTLEDILNAISFGVNTQYTTLTPEGIYVESQKFIQSLSQPKSWQIEGEWVDDKFKIIKITL